MVASSEQHNAPVMVSNPAKAHARSNHPGAPLNRDDSAEVIKMPDPIIEPITIIVASMGPSARIRLEDDGSFAVLLAINDEARMGNHELMTKHKCRILWRSCAEPFLISSFRFPSSFNVRFSSFFARRAYANSFVFELSPQLPRELDGPGSVAMNTNGLAMHIDIAAFDGADFAFAQHPQDALGSLFRIVKQRIRAAARNKPAGIQVIAIGEKFSRDLQTLRFACASKLALVRCKQN